MSLQLRKIKIIVLLAIPVLILHACGGGSTTASSNTNNQQADCGGATCKPLPMGVYESAGINDPVGNAANSTALQGVLVRISWGVFYKWRGRSLPSRRGGVHRSGLYA